MSDVGRWEQATVEALAPLADAEHARAQQAYMKDVAPFLGMYTADRRAALRAAGRGLPPLDEGGLAQYARRMWARREREYQYCACDLLARQQRVLSAAFVRDPLERLLTTKPWWDTVDALGAVITPVVARNPELVDLMWQWLRSDDRWLVRAAIGHQRGRKTDTDLALLYAMCDRVADDREFFVAKAVGWVLRDAAALDPDGVAAFLDAHPALPTVARREAVRGLARHTAETPQVVAIERAKRNK